MGTRTLRALVVDDDALIARTVVRLLGKMQVDSDAAHNVEAALEMLSQQRYQIVITDLRLPDQDGASLFRQVRERFGPQLPVIIMTAHATVDAAVTLLKEGVNDFIEKPIIEMTFRPRVEKVLAEADLRAEVTALRAELSEVKATRPILGESPLLRQVLGQLPTIARSDAAVLVLGESGTGKELIARAVHDLSERREGPFVTVNCGALPEALLESELFGHVKGAFTDARSDKAGMAAEAHNGTLFLDEIGELPLPVQVKLLRFLQEKEVRPVGANKARKVDARIVAATNRDLSRESKEGRFREDLYYRINVLPVRLPPLRHRKEDLPLLVDYFVERFSKEHKKERLTVSPSALQKLTSYEWPGNIRELENVLRRAVILSLGSELQPSDITLEESSPAATATNENLSFQDAKARVVADFERSYLTGALAAHHGNISRAADASGKDRKSFWELLQKYQIDAEQFRPK